MTTNVNDALIAALTPAAVEAGLLDADFAKLADLSLLSIDGSGKVSGVEATIAVLRRDKPAWFKPQSTSSTATPPKPGRPNGRGVLDLPRDAYEAAKRAVLRSAR
jgi:hypothetical protein